MKGLLDGAVRLVMFQFILGNTNALPAGLFEKNEEGGGNGGCRPGVEGVKFIESTKEVFLREFVADLAAAGYAMADAFYQVRTNARGNDYLIVRFIFALKDTIPKEGWFAEHKDTAETAFSQLSSQSLWSMEVYLNPFYKDGQTVMGERAISVNLAARSPLTDEKGNLLLRWKKDEAGERIGDGPVPIEPKKFLRIADDDICIVSAE